LRYGFQKERKGNREKEVVEEEGGGGEGVEVELFLLLFEMPNSKFDRQAHVLAYSSSVSHKINGRKVSIVELQCYTDNRVRTAVVLNSNHQSERGRKRSKDSREKEKREFSDLLER